MNSSDPSGNAVCVGFCIGPIIVADILTLFGADQTSDIIDDDGETWSDHKNADTEVHFVEKNFETLKLMDCN